LQFLYQFLYSEQIYIRRYAKLGKNPKVQCLVRNTHSGIYYARATVNGKLLWKTLETDSPTVAKARLPKVLAELGRGCARLVRSAGHPILSFGDAATLHLANIQARVDLKPATKHYWNQVVAALLASWPDLAERKLTKILGILRLPTR
jgi:hypothetical protein